MEFAFSPNQYESLLKDKISALTDQFKELGVPEIEVFPSSKEHFRMRAEFRIWHEDDRCFYAMYKPGSKQDIYEVKEFPIADKAICELMPKLLDKLNDTPELKRRLFQVEFLATLSGDMLVTLIYHRPLEEEWKVLAAKLKKELGIHLIGRSRKQKILLDQDFVVEKLPVDGKEFIYKQIEGGFTQPNAEINCKMLEWTRQISAPLNGDLLELYCGNGNFSIALSDCFDQVVATEISKTSVAAAEFNKNANGIENLNFARMSAEEFTQAMNGVRKFRRLQNMDLTNKNFTTVLVDPPRAGLDEESVEMIQAYDRIIYISCNPNTLKTNLVQLSTTHKIEKFAAFDQFPYTDHIESGVLLVRK